MQRPARLKLLLPSLLLLPSPPQVYLDMYPLKGGEGKTEFEAFRWEGPECVKTLFLPTVTQCPLEEQQPQKKKQSPAPAGGGGKKKGGGGAGKKGTGAAAAEEAEEEEEEGER